MSTTNIQDYQRRFKQALHELRMRGVFPQDILNELRESSDDHRWDDAAGVALLRAVQTAMPSNIQTWDEILRAMCMHDLNGDPRMGEVLTHGRPLTDRFTPGYYALQFETAVMETYCKCLYASTAHRNNLERCAFCVERARLKNLLSSAILTEEVSERDLTTDLTV